LSDQLLLKQIIIHLWYYKYYASVISCNIHRT